MLLARWLAREPSVLLLNDPTRGVDQRTRETLYQAFRELAHNQGMALVVLSSEIEEILRLCDRVLVFREQRPRCPLLRRGDDKRDRYRRNVRTARMSDTRVAADSAPPPGDCLLRTAERRETGLAAALLFVLLTVNAILNPEWLAPRAWGTVIGLAGPLVAASIASMPSILGGRGGIDVSIGPLMGFINVVIVKTLMTDLGVSSPWIVVVAALVIGAAVGALNGILTTVVRIQPIVATLGTYLVLNGVMLTLLP